ncbi:MAG: GDYXXLXY domain-containing protein [Hyphomicrobium sp.]|jgi:uncharacterized membrane-anchored protein|nr:GDYXXLXY domain-containing protein [Hyphomicrobium sp.]
MIGKPASRLFLGLAVLVAALQSAALAYIVVARDRLLKTGREVVLSVTPVDPRDLFRGDYVTLGYDITRISGDALAPRGDVPEGIERGGTFYAVLSLDAASNTWSVARVSADYPRGVGADEVVIKGRARAIYTTPATRQEAGTATLLGRYGIESYFVPEGTGRALEEKVRSHSIKAVVAVGADGTAALKGLIVDGERRDLPAIF